MIIRTLLRTLFKLTIGFALLSIVITGLFRWMPIPITGVIIERQLTASFSDQHIPFKKSWIKLEDVSPALPLAVIAAEDQKFFEHHGFDWQSIYQALKHNLNHRRIRGGSTLSQQTAKNMFLWSERSWVRKGLETWFTLLIETLWPKQRIVEVYINIVEFGSGIYGAEAASQHFFGKSAKSLNAHEAALLAAVLPNPHRYRVEQPSNYVRKRQQWILLHMNKLGGSAFSKQLRKTNN